MCGEGRGKTGLPFLSSSGSWVEVWEETTSARATTIRQPAMRRRVLDMNTSKIQDWESHWKGPDDVRSVRRAELVTPGRRLMGGGMFGTLLVVLVNWST